MTPVPKICILTETYYPVVGGGETQARTLAEGLVTNGFSVIVLTRRSHASFRKIEQFGQVTVYRLSPTGHEHFKKWGLLFTSFLALIKFRQEYDLVFVSGYRVVGITAVIVSKLFRKACVLKADSLGEMSGEFFAAGLARIGLRPSSPVFRIFLWLRDNILKKADAFVAISSAMVWELMTHGVDPTLIGRIPNSVNTHRFFPVSAQHRDILRQKFGIPLGDKIVIYTGRLVSYKGLPLLLRVWRDIQAIHSHVRLLLVGSGGLDIHNCEADLKAYVHENGLQASVRFTGSVHNVYDYLQLSDIFVFPTEKEAFGISLIEAMACGLPVISTPVGGIEDIITHMHDGFLVQAGDYQQTRDALDALINDIALAARLGDAARHTVRDRYSAENVTRKYVTLFTAFANSSGKSRPSKETD